MDPHPAPLGQTKPSGWRGDFTRKIIGVLIIKLIGLITLKLLFFSPSHRTYVDDALAERQFSLAPENTHD